MFDVFPDQTGLRFDSMGSVAIAIRSALSRQQQPLLARIYQQPPRILTARRRNLRRRYN
jgi:hypothetical protein